jgi:acyl carrier protein
MKEKIEKLVATHFGLGKVHEDDNLISDLGGDALDIIELVMELEEEFNIQILDNEAEQVHTVQDVYNCVVAKLPQHLVS